MRGGGILPKVIARFLTDLDKDKLLDRMGGVALLRDELMDAESGPNKLCLRDIDLVILDGFHRFEPAELELVANLSRQRDVLVWLVGVPDRQPWENLQQAVRILTKAGGEPRVIVHQAEECTPLAAVGRGLFASSSSPPSEGGAGGVTEPALFNLQAPTPLAEVEAVARQIKTDYLEARRTGQPFRLSDVAVVIPGPGYDALVREAFPRAGLEFNLAGRALEVSTSRPARALTAALELIRGQCRFDLLRDFLQQPLVARRLEESFRLHDLFEQRPRTRQRLDHAKWTAAWKEHLAKVDAEIARLQAGTEPLKDESLDRAELTARKEEAREGTQRLIASIQKVLEPVARLEELIAKPPKDAPLRALVECTAILLRQLDIQAWLTPPRADQLAAAPWVEYEKDQQAHFTLLGILETLAAVPADRLPLRAKDQPDLLAALELALDSETYQIRTEDDAGVQIFEVREIRGLRFKHVYALGLVEGQVPLLPEEGMLASFRRGQPLLSEQLEAKECEACHLFTQLFEAASEKLVLSQPKRDSDRDTAPSPFLAAVEEVCSLKPIEAPALVVCERDAAGLLGRASIAKRAGQQSLAQLWPGAGIEKVAYLTNTHQALAGWQQRDDWPRKNCLNVPELLRLRFPAERHFSPTELEQYAACPFRYFANKVLRLKEREPDTDFRNYGSLVHKVLHRFYSSRRDQAEAAGTPVLPVSKLADRAELLKFIDEEWQALPADTIPPNYRQLLEAENGVLDFFFDVITHIEGDGRFKNLHTELKLPEVVIGTDGNNVIVKLVGNVDRVDARSAASPGAEVQQEAIILDFKTGRKPGNKDFAAKVKDGRMLQLPLYGYMLGQVPPGLLVIGGAYVHLTSKKGLDHEKPYHLILGSGELPGNGNGSKKDNTPEFSPNNARDKALEIVERIRGGDFSLTAYPPSSDLPECSKNCPMRHACRQPEGYEKR